MTLEGSGRPDIGMAEPLDGSPSEISENDPAMVSLGRESDADQRDRNADERDRLADERDGVADQRDRIALQFEALIPVGVTADGIEWSAVARRDARTGRRYAAENRRLKAVGRRQAERDRGSAKVARDAMPPRESLAVDDLTGLYRRNEGFAELTRELARAKRTATPLIVAFVDVDGLKTINDTRGHAAGDAMLVAVARILQRELRVYDIIFRYGGDEIVCALQGIDRAETTKRLGLISEALSLEPEPGSITVGLAEMRRDDTAHALVARADEALYIERRSASERSAMSAAATLTRG